MSNQVTVSKIVALPNFVLDEFKARSIDADKVLNSINAARARAQLDGSKFKAGAHKMSAKDGLASFSESETKTFISDELGVQFQAWIDAKAKMHKQFGYDEALSFPTKFVNWLAKHKIAASEEMEPDKEQEPAEATA